MASGKLGAADLAAATEVELYSPAASTLATVTVAFCNRGTATAKIRIALSASGDAAGTADDWLEYDRAILAHESFERTGITVGSQGKIFVESDTANVSAIAMGFEESV